MQITAPFGAAARTLAIAVLAAMTAAPQSGFRTVQAQAGQKTPFEAAPLPQTPQPDRSPAAVSGAVSDAAGPVNSTPFSAAPSGELVGSNGSATAAESDRVLGAPATAGTTPNLSK